MSREWIALVIHLNRQLKRALVCLRVERAKRWKHREHDKEGT